LLTKYEIMQGDLKKGVYFFSKGTIRFFKNKTKFKLFVVHILKSEGLRLGIINFIFCSDDELKKLNYDFLNHDYYTDILTFSLSDIKNVVTADIYISIDRVKDNSTLFKVPIVNELHRVMIHGLLHLCGYKDKKRLDIKKMKAQEDKYLKIYFQ